MAQNMQRIEPENNEGTDEHEGRKNKKIPKGNERWKGGITTTTVF